MAHNAKKQVLLVSYRYEEPLCTKGDIQYLSAPSSRHTARDVFTVYNDGQFVRNFDTAYNCSGEPLIPGTSKETARQAALDWAKERGVELEFC